MKCQGCDNTATIHITEITNGQRVEMHLCQACAEKQGVAVKNQIPLNELLSTLLAVQSGISEDDIVLENPADSGRSCPNCGITMNDFSKEGLLGCPGDYDTFSDSLEPVIEKTQGGAVEHTGKVPSSTPEQTRQQMEIARLQKQLENAVKDEDYEKAAKLRDKINSLQ